MKRFHFSLQSVLAVREAKVDQAEAALAERQRNCRALRERLASLRDAEARTLAELAGGPGAAQPGSSALPVRRTYLSGVGQQIKALEAALAAEQANIVDLRRALLECSRDEQIIERLKTRKVKLFRSEMAREQQAEIDEVAGGRKAVDAFRRSAS